VISPVVIITGHFRDPSNYPHNADRQGVDITVSVGLFCVCVCICTVTDFSAKDKASGVKFCTAVDRRPMQLICHFGGL